MAGSARPFAFPVGLAFAVCLFGLATDDARAESGDGSGLVLGGVTAYAAGTSLNALPDDTLTRALNLPLSRGPAAHVPLPRERASAPGGDAAMAYGDTATGDAAGESPAMAGLRASAPLPRQRPDAAEAEPADEPSQNAAVPLPPQRPDHVASLAGDAAAPAALPVFASPGAETGAGMRTLIARHATANGIPFGLADAVVRFESRYNPHARNGANIGLMQISLPTARSLGYGGPAAGLADAETNLTYGVRYLAQAYRLADGDTCRTILKYQGGHRAVSMTSAARSYCDKVRMHAANLR